MLKDHNAVTQVRLEPAAPLSRVKHSTNEPLRSHLCHVCNAHEMGSVVKGNTALLPQKPNLGIYDSIFSWFASQVKKTTTAYIQIFKSKLKIRKLVSIVPGMKNYRYTQTYEYEYAEK